MILKIRMQHWGLKLYKVCINDDPVLTLTCFTAGSNLVDSVLFDLGKAVTKSFNGKN